MRPPADLWCAGPILEAVQRARIFPDSKDFVDSPLRPEVSYEEALRRWALLPQPITDASLRSFVSSTFAPPGSDLERWTPPDFSPCPPLLHSLHGEAREFAAHLNGLWPLLGRRAKAGGLGASEAAAEQATEPSGGDIGGSSHRDGAMGRVVVVAEAHARAQATHGEEERMGEPLLGGTSAVGEASLGGDAPAGEVPMSWRASAPLFRRSTLLPPRSGFVVPGGRFREMYYWDSLWVVLGLMAVGMRQTAEGMCGLLLDQVEQYGFVPNGARSYYLNRSQPPLLTQMVASLLGLVNVPRGGAAGGGGTECEDSIGGGLPGWPGDTVGGGASSRAWRVGLLRRALPLLDREYSWWMRGGEDGSAVTVGGREYRRGGGEHGGGTAGGAGGGGSPLGANAPLPAILNRYVVSACGPRPESMREDEALAGKREGAARVGLFRELAAGAASGWDYSTRWEGRGGRGVGGVRDKEGAEGGGKGRGADGAADVTGAEGRPTEGAATPCLLFDLGSIRTSQIVPVELNAILYANEVSLSRMHALLRDDLDAIAAEAASAPPLPGRPAPMPASSSHSPFSSLPPAAAAPAPIPSSSPSTAAATSSASYAHAAAARRLAIQKWMWAQNENTEEAGGSPHAPPVQAHSAPCTPPPPDASRPPPGRWHDLDLSQGGARLPGISAACFTPLWAAVHTSPAQAAAAVDALAGSGLIQVGGLATTLRASGQQWDWPNGWPPLQQMIVQGLARSRDARGEAMGRELAGAWLVNNYAGWRRSGFMHEKYDVTQIGHRGGGGEYEPQVGFGWTNGVVLWLLCEYGGEAIEECAAAQRAAGECAASGEV